MLVFFFFFKQKTAYEIMPSLVGSEMCIRDRYNALKGPGDITTPTTSFQNEVKNLDVYITTHDNKTIKALVNITTLYSIGGVANKPINQIYELELKEQEKEWIITKYTLMGNFAPYSTNQ